MMVFGPFQIGSRLRDNIFNRIRRGVAGQADDDDNNNGEEGSGGEEATPSITIHKEHMTGIDDAASGYKCGHL